MKNITMTSVTILWIILQLVVYPALRVIDHVVQLAFLHRSVSAISLNTTSVDDDPPYNHPNCRLRGQHNSDLNDSGTVDYYSVEAPFSSSTGSWFHNGFNSSPFDTSSVDPGSHQSTSRSVRQLLQVNRSSVDNHNRSV
jgi:hypothetical protein